MEDKAHAELKRTVVESVHIDVDSDYFQSESFVLQTSGKAELRVPKEKDDPTFLLVYTLKTSAEEQPDAFQAVIETNFFFELDQLVKDYDEVIRDQCLPIIKSRQEELINKLLLDMGYSGLSGEYEENSMEKE